MTPLQTWTSTVAFWSTVAQAPSRVARAQTAATLRMMRVASPWRAAQRPKAVEAPVVAEPIEAAAAVVESVEAVIEEPVAEAVAVIETVAETVEEPLAAKPVEVVPHDALIHASPAAIAAATAEEVEALPVEEPAPVPVEATVPEAPALAVLAEPAPDHATTLSHLAVEAEPVAVEPELEMAAASAVHGAAGRARPAPASRNRKPRRG